MSGDRWEYRTARDAGLSPVERSRSLARENGLLETTLQQAWWSLVRGWLAAWHRLRIEGRENLPDDAPFVLVANHASHLDALVLAAPLRLRTRQRAFPIAAGDTFFERPTASLFASVLLNALPMWRRGPGRHALGELRTRLLEEPCGYVLFPEGTRSRDGRPGRFKPGVGMLVAGTTVPVVPCHIAGGHEAWPPGRRLPRPRRVRVRVGRPHVFDDVTNDRAGWVIVAERLRDAVLDLAPPDTGGVESAP